MSAELNEQISQYQAQLEKGLHLQDLMKKANAIIKKNISVEEKVTHLVSLGLSKSQAENILQPDFAGRKGFPTYKLTNNNANNRRIEERIATLKKKLQGAKAVASSGQAEEYIFDGGTIEVNYDIDRVQILFPGGRVDKEMYKTLRGNGYVYSPSNKAFQRKITPQAINNAIRLFDAKKVTAEEIEKGIEVESEHADTLNKIASGEISVEQAPEEIAKDHLTEDTKYYDKLEAVEGKKVQLPQSIWDVIAQLNHAQNSIERADIWNANRSLNLPKINKTLWQIALDRPYTEVFRTGTEKRISFSGFDLHRAIKSAYAEHDLEISDKTLKDEPTPTETPKKPGIISNYVMLNQNVGSVAKDTIGRVMSKPNMFVTEVYFGKNRSGQMLVNKIDNGYLIKLTEVPELVNIGGNEKFVLPIPTAKEEIISPNTDEEFDNEIDKDWDLDRAKKYKEVINLDIEGFKNKFNISTSGFDQYKLHLLFKNKDTGEIDLARNARLGNYSPNAFAKMQDIEYWLHNAVQYLEDQPELIKQNLSTTNKEWTSRPRPKETLGKVSRGVIEEYADIEDELINQLELQGELTRSDAQGVLEANEQFAQDQYGIGVNTPEIAKRILNLGKITPKNPFDFATGTLEQFSDQVYNKGYDFQLLGTDKKMIQNLVKNYHLSEDLQNKQIQKDWIDQQILREFKANQHMQQRSNSKTLIPGDIFENANQRYVVSKIEGDRLLASNLSDTAMPLKFDDFNNDYIQKDHKKVEVEALNEWELANLGQFNNSKNVKAVKPGTSKKTEETMIKPEATPEPMEAPKSDYQKELERQLAAGDIEDDKNGISISALSRQINMNPKPLKKSKPTTNQDAIFPLKQYDNQFALNRGIEEYIDKVGFGLSPSLWSVEGKAFIKKYSGYGGLSQYGTAGKGAFFEYYTPVPVIKKMWALAYKYGYKGGPILESSVGTGEFLQFAPEGAKIDGYEINNYSAEISRILYPNATIHTMPFEKRFIENNFTVKNNVTPEYDLCIGNPPYGSFEVVESRYMSGMGEGKHVQAKNYAEYFMRRSVDLLKPGGLLVIIVGASVINGGRLFLDSENSVVKEYLAEHTELLDAYRLPDSIFERTDVTSEIIVLQKK